MLCIRWRKFNQQNAFLQRIKKNYSMQKGRKRRRRREEEKKLNKHTQCYKNKLYTVKAKKYGVTMIVVGMLVPP